MVEVEVEAREDSRTLIAVFRLQSAAAYEAEEGCDIKDGVYVRCARCVALHLEAIAIVMPASVVRVPMEVCASAPEVEGG